MKPKILPAEMVDVHARIPKDQYDALLAECGHCACSLTGFIRVAISREIGHRKGRRQQAANHAVLAGQIDMEGRVNG